MDYMLRALALAAQAQGRVSPNPAVGAVLVKDGKVVGEGFTQLPGGDHAEIVALRQAGEAARGATMHVTLEPCCHQGRTPPCTDALVRAGLTSVNVAVGDPSPWVNGRGIAALEAAGISVIVGAHTDAARRLNQAYFKWATRRLPLVTAKFAMTLDGKVATRAGSSRWISGERSRELVGRMRSACDAVLVGVDTVLADDPELTARQPDGSLLPRQPLRVVVDTHARTPPTARLLRPGSGGRVLLLVADQADAEQLSSSGEHVELLRVPRVGDHIDLSGALAALGERQITSVLVESGGRLLAALIEQRLVDRVAAFIAPKIVGGRSAPTPVEGEGIADMSQAIALADITYERVGDDLLVTGSITEEEPCSPG